MKFKILNPANLFILLTITGVWYIVSTVTSPFLHFQLQQTAFITGREFFQNYSDYPGGIADYCSIFIAQFFYLNSLGSALIIAIASIQGFITLNIVQILTGKRILRYAIFTLILLFGAVALSNYLYPYYITIRLLFAFIFTWLFCKLHQKFPKYSAFYWFIFAGFLFYVASGPALFVFTLSSVFIYLKTINQKMKWLTIPLIVIFAGILPFLAFKFIFQMSLENLYKISIMKPPAMLAYTPELPVYIYYALLPLILSAVLLFSFLPDKKSASGKIREKTAAKFTFFRHEIIAVSLQVIVFSALAYLLFKNGSDPLKKNLLTIEYYAEHEQWKEVLKTTKYIKEYDFRVNFHGARALSRLGLLPDQLFDYPQLLGTYGLFIDANMARSASIVTSDLYFDLGYMSESQHWAFEAQTLLPDSPRILKRLIMINLVKRNYLLANKFLNILDKNMLCREWVRKYERYVADTTLTDKDSLIAEKRRFSPVKTVINTGDEECLKLLVETCKDNRMAYDYLLSYYLLDTNIRKFIEYLQYYTNYNIKIMPRSWEEALIMYVAQTKIVPYNFSPQIVTEKSVKKFNDFTHIINQNKNDLKAAKNALYTKYGNTFWFYNLYLNPKVTNVLSNKTEVK